MKKSLINKYLIILVLVLIVALTAVGCEPDDEADPLDTTALNAEIALEITSQGDYTTASFDAYKQKLATAKQLASHFKTFENLKNATVDQLVELNDISYITANGIVEYFKDQNNILELEKLEISGVKPKEHKLAKSISDSIFSGKKVVLTGTLQTLSRPKATEILENLGAEVVSSVSKNTDFVIVGQDAGSKLQKAISLNVKTLNEQEFLNYVNKN